MARNGSGNYTKVNTFTAGTPITAASHNQNWDDLAAEITNSVAADGQTSMTGPLKASSGTAAAPSHTFASDVDTGGYRSAANEYSVAAGGVQVTAVNSTGLDIKTGSLKLAGSAVFPLATANLADDAVTYAKIQNVSATKRVLARKTAAAGDVEECTAEEVLEFIGTAAQGDIFYRDGSTTVRLPAGTAGYFLRTNGAGANPDFARVLPLFHVRDQKTSGTNGQSLGGGSWTTRTLQTTVTNEITSASLSSNQISLPAGTYEMDARASIYSAGGAIDARTRLRLRNITDGATTLVGMGSSLFASGTASGAMLTDSVCGRFTIAGTKTFEVQHYTNSALTGGIAAASGEVEIYCEVMIRKVG